MAVSPIHKEVVIPPKFNRSQSEYLQANRGKDLSDLAEDTGLTPDDVAEFYSIVPHRHNLFIKREGVVIMTKEASSQG